jgi:hypothetical protein
MKRDFLAMICLTFGILVSIVATWTDTFGFEVIKVFSAKTFPFIDNIGFIFALGTA